jgi:hypothetical protein
MADPHEFDDVMPENTSRREPEQPVEENLFTRLVYMIIIALMISFAGTVIGVLALLQFIIMLVNQKQPNERIAELGTDVGIWVAKATRYQTAASEDKPYPTTNLTDKVSQVRGGVWQFPLRNLRASLRNWGAQS